MTGYVDTFGAKLTTPRMREHIARNGTPFVAVTIAEEVTVTIKDPAEADQLAAAFTKAGRALRTAQAEGKAS